MTHDENTCRYCGYDIGPIEYEQLTEKGDTETQHVNYCSGCGKHINDALHLEDRFIKTCPHCGRIAVVNDLEEIDCPER